MIDPNSALVYAPTTDVGSATPDPFRSLPVRLHRLREAISSRFRPVFLEHGITDPQWRMMRILNSVEEMEFVELARKSLLMGPSLSRIVRDLTARGLVARRSDPQDQRRAFIAITDMGRALIAEVAPKLRPTFDQLKKQMTDEEIRTLNAMLDHALAILSEAD